MQANKDKSNWFLNKNPSVTFVIADDTADRLEYLNRVGIFPQLMQNYFQPEDELLQSGSPTVIAKRVAEGKARDVVSKLRKKKVKYDVIMAYHTITVMDNEIIPKPLNRDTALSTLKKLSNKSHNVITGVALLDAAGNCVLFDVATEVKFAAVSEENVQEYVKSDLWHYTCVGYDIDKQGSVFVEKLNGSYYNVMGVPAFETVERLQKFLIDYKKKTTTYHAAYQKDYVYSKQNFGATSQNVSTVFTTTSAPIMKRKLNLPPFRPVYIVSAYDVVTPSNELQEDNAYDVPTGLAAFPQSTKSHSFKYSDSLDWQ